MKPGIHPTWYPEAVVTCACGNSWTTGSTKKEIHTDVCNKCHPFFTGEQRIVDTAGQVERFMKRINAKEQIAASQPAPEDKKAKKEKRREHKAGTTVSLKPAVEAPSELPLAVVDEKPVVAAMPAAKPEVEEPVAKIDESKVAESAAQVEEAAPVAQLDIVEDTSRAEEPVPAAHIEEPAPIATIDETAPVAFVEESAPATIVEETTPVAAVKESAPVPIVEETIPVAAVEESAPAAHVEEAAPVTSKHLTIVEGIGPKVASVLHDAGIATLEQLSNANVNQLTEILKGANLNLADPATWPEQAKLAVEGKTEELQKLQNELAGGRRVKKTAARKNVAKDETKKAAPAKPKASRAKKEEK